MPSAPSVSAQPLFGPLRLWAVGSRGRASRFALIALIAVLSVAVALHHSGLTMNHESAPGGAGVGQAEHPAGHPMAAVSAAPVRTDPAHPETHSQASTSADLLGMGVGDHAMAVGMCLAIMLAGIAVIGAIVVRRFRTRAPRRRRPSVRRPMPAVPMHPAAWTQLAREGPPPHVRLCVDRR